MSELLFVSCLSQWQVAQDCLLASPCLQPGGHPLVMRWNARSAAEALNSVLDSQPPQRWVVWLHQDVRLPAGWDQRFISAVAAAEMQLGPLAVVGAYGLRGAGAQAQRAGRVLDRGQLLEEPTPLPCLADSLDELLFAMRADCGLRLDPALGFDFYATDLVLQAQAAGLQCAVVDAYCEHWSDTPVAPPIPQALAQRVSASGATFEAKWAQRLPVTTPCFTIEQPGDIAAAAFSLTLAQPAQCGKQDCP